MPIVNETAKIAYYSIPKVACTSQKTMHYDAMYNRSFAPENHDGQRLHQFFRCEKFDVESFRALAEYWIYTVVRDPIKRVLSAYAQKIVDKNELRAGGKSVPALLQMERVGLNPNPSLDEFCLNINDYKEKSPNIRHHVRHFSYFIGNKLDRFNAVYPIENVSMLERDLSERMGRNMRLPRMNETRSRVEVSDLSAAAHDALLEFTAQDYRLLGELYSPPTRVPSQASAHPSAHLSQNQQ